MARTQGSATFAPDTFFDSWAQGQITPPYDNDFRKFILRAFSLLPSDAFIYRASTEVTLLQVQTYTEFGAQGGLHAWYRDANDDIVREFIIAVLLFFCFFLSLVCARRELGIDHQIVVAETTAPSQRNCSIHGPFPTHDQHNQSTDSARVQCKKGLDPRRSRGTSDVPLQCPGSVTQNGCSEIEKPCKSILRCMGLVEPEP